LFGIDGVNAGNNFFGTAAGNANSIRFGTNGTNQMLLQNGTGNLGIGGVPNNKLDVFNGDIDVNTANRSYMIADQQVLWHKGGNTSIFVGVGAGNNNNNLQSQNTYVGYQAGFNGLGNSAQLCVQNVMVGDQCELKRC
jgi:hypothetical protein